MANVHLDDIQAILNMRDEWSNLLNTIDELLMLDYICKLNGYIARNEALECVCIGCERTILLGQK